MNINKNETKVVEELIHICSQLVKQVNQDGINKLFKKTESLSVKILLDTQIDEINKIIKEQMNMRVTNRLQKIVAKEVIRQRMSKKEKKNV
jgi:hypothetical protein